jgi:hypothetical protein
MAEVTNELIFEALKSVQARVGNIEDGLNDVKGQINALRTSSEACPTGCQRSTKTW